MDLGLTDKIAFVTGSSRGLGYACAEVLLLEQAKTIINSRSLQNLQSAKEKLLNSTHQMADLFAGDVTAQNFAGESTAFIESKFGKLDLLITNSGGPPPGTIETLTDQQWQDAIELSFLCHMRLIRAALPLLRKSECPSILTITSYSVKQPIENLILSNSIRSATVGLTKTLALELGKENIRVNSILPGSTNTERITALFENNAKLNNTTPEAEREKQEKAIALGRIAKPAEFARAAVFLASPAASYLTGVMLSVDGGAVKGVY
ncbi:MAG: 3-oxoacyl-ACP reductase [Chloroflexi bacterium 44-23]|nr:MAG: 3-oxoacyl-ACP reductase [Chloroflexi bacterium 44-23]